jgi:hypothetical protein
MAMNRNVKAVLLANAECNLERLADPDRLSLRELVQISEQQERELIQYLMAQPQARFDKLTKALEPRWKYYSELKLRNRKLMQEICEGSDQVERAN